MKRIAILGGGIAGLAAAYELELARQRGAEIDWHLYESTNRLGGILETTTHQTEAGDYILEGGPDAWVTEKPWARDLALELGLEDQLIASNDATKKTYIYIDGKLQPMPARMRMMVPEDLATLAASPLFTESARTAYAAELRRAEELKATAPQSDESVAGFVLRHFGEEVLTRIAAPLLSGVFGGDVAKLSVRAVMPAFVAMEREHGSLILALQERTKARGSKPPQPTFTSLKRGMGALTAAIITTLPTERLHLQRPAASLKREGKLWCLRTINASGDGPAGKSKRHFHHVLIATPIDTTRSLLQPLDAAAAALIPTDASSAVLATFVWPAETAGTFTIPTGFGFLVPQLSSRTCHLSSRTCHPEPEPAKRAEGEGPASRVEQQKAQLLACTFADQKFPNRAPSGARILRVFFGGTSADALTPQPDATIATEAFHQLAAILGPLPQPDAALTTVRRWPRSLPQYEVGHIERIAALDTRIATLDNLTLLGNGYRGVGVPDLIRDARNAARALAER